MQLSSSSPVSAPRACSEKLAINLRIVPGKLIPKNDERQRKAMRGDPSSSSSDRLFEALGGK
jgi:hypothetical protein